MKLLSFFRVLYASEGNINNLLKLCAQFLNAERVSLWAVKEDILFCEHMYIKSTDEFMGGLLLRREKCLELLHTLEKEGVFLAQRLQDQMLKDCMGEYLSFVDTKALAIVPLLQEAKLDGFIMCESQHERSWDDQDVGVLLCASAHIRNQYERQRISFSVNMYKTLSAVNQALIKAKSREEIFQELCRIAIETAGFRMAWIGLLDDAGNIKPVSWYGHVENYLESISINIYSEKLNKGPSARAILEKRVQVNNDTETEPSVLEWRTQMLKRGYLSSCAYPIRLKDEVIGTLNLYSDRKGVFTDEVVKLVEEMGEDLSFALEHIDLLKSMEIMRMVIEQSQEWTMITDTEGNIIYVNPAVERISGYSREELLGNNPRVFKSGFHSREFYKDLWNTILSGEPFRAVFVNRRKDGSLFYLDVVISPVKDHTGSTMAFASTGRDITQEKHLEEKILRIINYDILTGLPTKLHFFRELERTIREKPGSYIAILLMDIHNLGGINAFYGHEFGDKVLRAFAENLSKLPGFCARYGNDEFIMFKEIQGVEDVYELISLVFKACNLKIGERTYNLGLHIGISIYPTDGQEVEELANSAGIALKKAKEQVPGSYEFYNPREGERVLQIMTMEEELRHALERKEFLIYFQPVYRSSDLKIAGAEELLRWNSKKLGMVSAKDFVPILEKTGLILDIGDYVLDKCIQIIKEYGINIPISINLSPLQLRQKDLVKKLCGIVEVSGIPPNLLNLEITEEMLIEDLESAGGTVKELKACGFLITLDDFGVRYSSLSYLSNLQVDYIKIDISFTKLVDTDEKTFRVVMAILSVAKALKIKTVAEGVERKTQLDILRDLGCDYVQGFYLSRPLPLEEFISILSIY